MERRAPTGPAGSAPDERKAPGLQSWSERHAVGSGDTIFALSTPPGRSAVAVIRVSGPQAGAVLARLSGRALQPRQACFARFRDPQSGAVLDEGLALWFPAPASFTGEDCAELQVHGSAATVAALACVLDAQPGLREATPGEFTSRAFANGKIDLPRVEALADLINAQTERQRRLALRAFESGPARLADTWRDIILDAIAAIDARLDFSDEGDVDALGAEGLAGTLTALANGVGEAVTTAERAARIREGFVVAICGPPNSGKSTLLNALAGRDQAIVSPHAGTTRDLVEVSLDLGGLPVTLIDTAGIRATHDLVERIGVSRALGAAARADYTIWLEAPDVRAEPEPSLRVDLRLLSKRDVFPDSAAPLQISAQSGENLDRLIATLAAKAAGDLDETGDAVTLRTRHVAAACAVRDEVLAAVSWLREDRLELAAAHLRGALASVAALGSNATEESVLDRVFARFCIGK